MGACAMCTGGTGVTGVAGVTGVTSCRRVIYLNHTWVENVVGV